MNVRSIRKSVLISSILGITSPLAIAQVYAPPTPTPPNAGGTYGQVYTPAPPPAPDYYDPATAPPVAAPQAIPQYQPQQLDQMLGPVALYPDPLLSETLAACTYPLDVSSAARWVQYYPGFSQYDIDAQPWAPSVKAIVHYPTVLQLLANNLDWAQAIGTAFTYQPADVMNSVQRLRYSAQAAGALYSTPQQQVVTVDGAIRIIPTEPTVVYVPQYDPGVVYVRRGYPVHDAIRFSSAYSTGPWLHLDFDWGNHYVIRGAHWDEHVDHSHWSEGPRWEHDMHRPEVVAPRPYSDVHRGWDTHPDYGHPLEPRPRGEVQHEEQRGHESLHTAPSHEERAPAHEEHAPSHEERSHESREHASSSRDQYYPGKPAVDAGANAGTFRDEVRGGNRH